MTYASCIQGYKSLGLVVYFLYGKADILLPSFEKNNLVLTQHHSKEIQ